jgi:hypothetical protein
MAGISKDKEIEGGLPVIKGGASEGHESTNTVYRDTYFCTTCKKIDCLTNNPGRILGFTLKNIKCNIIAPDSFIQLLLMLRVNQDDLSRIIETLMKNLEKQMDEFIQTGENPHNNNSIGFNKNIHIDRRNINVSVLMENMDCKLVLRIIYDGGHSQWD